MQYLVLSACIFPVPLVLCIRLMYRLWHVSRCSAIDRDGIFDVFWNAAKTEDGKVGLTNAALKDRYGKVSVFERLGI